MEQIGLALEARQHGLLVGELRIYFLVHSEFHRCWNSAEVSARLSQLGENKLLVEFFIYCIRSETGFRDGIAPSRPVDPEPSRLWNTSFGLKQSPTRRLTAVDFSESPYLV
jgi:hypothetical protein